MKHIHDCTGPDETCACGFNPRPRRTHRDIIEDIVSCAGDEDGNCLDAREHAEELYLYGFEAGKMAATPSSPTAEQFHSENGFEHERDARFASRDMAVELIELLKSKGYAKFFAPPKPNDNDDWIWDEFAHCRILIKYIMPHLPSRWAGMFALRVDTMAAK